MLHCVVRGGLRTQRNQGMLSHLKGFHFFCNVRGVSAAVLC